MESFKQLITEYYVPDLPSEVIMYLHMASYKIVAKTDEIALRFGITRTQFNILNILYHHYPKTANNNLLKDRTLIVKSDVSRIVKRLQKAGMVESTVDKGDRRAVNILITENGRKMFEEIIKHKDELLKPILVLSTEEITQMRSSLRKLLTELEK